MQKTAKRKCLEKNTNKTLKQIVKSIYKLKDINEHKGVFPLQSSSSTLEAFSTISNPK